MSVHICTPAYNGMAHLGFAESMIGLGYDLCRKGITVTSTMCRNGAFIEMARNILVNGFLNKTTADYLMFIDSDLTFEPDAVSRLVMAELPVCAGAYRQREEKIGYCIKIHEPLETRDGWLRADRIGTGFLCIRRDVLEYMVDQVDRGTFQKQEVPYLFKTHMGKTFKGEDFGWCDDYNKISERFGEPIWVWPDFNFDHAGYPGNFHEELLKC